jgi:CheY-like chemotaxis protein
LQVTAAERENALEAMATSYDSRPIDLIFLDIEMPEIDGISFLQMLKQNTGCYFHYCLSKLCGRGF